MRVPDGNDWLEYMLNVRNPTPKTRGVMNHLALGVPSVEAAYKSLTDRKANLQDQKPKIGRDGKWQLNLYDPNLTRVELMEPKPVETPCCSPMKPPRGGLGIFTDEGSVGKTPPGCKLQYDAEKGEYRITGGGANVWDTSDAFYFVWKRISGDATLTADVEWVGTSAVGHRKAMLMVRQSLDPGSTYADAVLHGDGLTSLQFRGAPNENTYQVFTHTDGPARLRIVREGSRYTMFSGKPGDQGKLTGPVEYVRMTGPVYIGLGVCSHVATALETAIFSNVTLEENRK
jgi:hypothetical protein